MRLPVDEMYPFLIAEELRRRDHDVYAVSERPEPRGPPDVELFEAAQGEQRTLVTENVRDLAPVAKGYASRGDAHFGLVFVDPATYPRGSSRTVGRMVTALDRVPSANPAGEATSFVHWL